MPAPPGRPRAEDPAELTGRGHRRAVRRHEARGDSSCRSSTGTGAVRGNREPCAPAGAPRSGSRASVAGFEKMRAAQRGGRQDAALGPAQATLPRQGADGHPGDSEAGTSAEGGGWGDEVRLTLLTRHCYDAEDPKESSEKLPELIRAFGEVGSQTPTTPNSRRRQEATLSPLGRAGLCAGTEHRKPQGSGDPAQRHQDLDTDARTERRRDPCRPQQPEPISRPGPVPVRPSRRPGSEPSGTGSTRTRERRSTDGLRWLRKSRREDSAAGLWSSQTDGDQAHGRGAKGRPRGGARHRRAQAPPPPLAGPAKLGLE